MPTRDRTLAAFGRNVARIRNERGFSQDKLAEQADLDRKLKVAVFVDGCFWHGCPRHAAWPAHRAAWWRQKLEGNRARDRLVTRTLRRAGWRVERIWEHELARRNETRLVTRLRAVLG